MHTHNTHTHTHDKVNTHIFGYQGFKYAHTYTHPHPHPPTHIHHPHTPTHPCIHAHTHTPTHTHACISVQWDWGKHCWNKKSFQGRFRWKFVQDIYQVHVWCVKPKGNVHDSSRILVHLWLSFIHEFIFHELFILIIHWVLGITDVHLCKQVQEGQITQQVNTVILSASYWALLSLPPLRGAVVMCATSAKRPLTDRGSLMSTQSELLQSFTLWTWMWFLRLGWVDLER